jgi:type IV pilus assembly protein PilQ
LGVTRTYTGSDGATNTIRGGVGTAGSDVALGDDVASATNFLVSGTSGLGIIRSTTSGELKFEIDALETEGDSKTLSNPKLFTISGKNAIIKQGTQVGINETTTTDGGTIQTSVKYYDANLLLDVTPIITGDGSVMMEVKINNDSFDLSVSPPKITKKEISTNLILVDGDIAVVGGILTETLSENNSRVPVLGKMPGVGTLFRSRAQVDDRQELLIFLAPRII